MGARFRLWPGWSPGCWVLDAGGVVRLLVGEGVMRRIVAVFTVAVAGFAVVPQMAVGALTERVSVASNGTQGNGDSGGGTPVRRR